MDATKSQAVVFIVDKQKPTITAKLDDLIPVNANNDNGSPWKPGQKFIPTKRDFNATNLLVNDPELRLLKITITGGLAGILYVEDFAPADGAVDFWEDRKKMTHFTEKAIPAGQNPFVITIYVEGTYESLDIQDVKITVEYVPTLNPLLTVSDWGWFTVTPVINSFEAMIPNPSVTWINGVDGKKGMQARNPTLPVGQQDGITFLADVMTTGNQPIKYLKMSSTR